jgi:two-component system, sensor histidine kinase and response regulator
MVEIVQKRCGPSDTDTIIFRSFAEASGQGFGIATLDGLISYCNPTLARLVGRESTDDIRGTSLPELYAEDVAERMTREILPAVFSSGQWTGELTLRSSDGNVIPVIQNAFLIRDQSGRPAYLATVITDITERKKAEENLSVALELRNKLLSTAATGIFTLDAEGTVNMVNDAYCFITGFQREEIVGRHYSVLGETGYLDTLDFLNPDWAKSVSRRESWIGAKDGRTLSVLMNSAPLTDDSGKIIGFVVSFVDVTETIEARQAAENASRAKSEFLANMSHEIRTPINGIMGMTELALNTELTTEQREYLDAVKVSAESLLQVINDILDFSKIEAEKLELTDIDFSLRELLADIMTMLAYQAHKKGLELLYDVDESVPDTLIGDPGRLRQILVNLAGNAIKFTQTGEIAARVDLESESEDGVTLHFCVSDTGIGVSREKQDRIFEAFEQADGSTTRRYGGTGLGLAVSKRLVSMMTGRIWVESEIGQGSSFHFTVRLAIQGGSEKSRAGAGEVNLPGVRILVVDDNDTNRRILEKTLLHWGMKPTLASGGREALNIMERAYADGAPFPLVLTDYMMPEMDGFEFVEHIRSNQHLTSPLIIMCTSGGERGDGARCMNLSVAGYLMKPVRQSELYLAICKVLQQPADQTGQRTLVTRHSIREGKRRLNVLLAEDNVVNQKLAEKILERMGHTVTVAEDGRKAVYAATGFNFDLILMDVQMPEMDGLEATKQIRRIQAETGIRTPILAMTAYAMKGDKERCLEAGMDGYVSKPIDIKELSDTIEKITSDVETPDQPKADASGIIDRDEVLERVAGDKELLNELIDLFIEDCPRLLAQVEQAIREQDPVRLEKAAHTLKGSVANFAADIAVKAALRLEIMGKGHDLTNAEEAFLDLKSKILLTQKELETVRGE